jgi:hypothetical protein
MTPSGTQNVYHLNVIRDLIYYEKIYELYVHTGIKVQECVCSAEHVQCDLNSLTRKTTI